MSTNNLFDPTKAKQVISIQKEEVRKYWHLVEPGLIKAIADLHTPGTWIAPDIYQSLVGGNATLLMCSQSRIAGYGYTSREQAIMDSCGFAVVQVVKSQGGQMALHVWFAASNDATNKGNTPSILFAFDNELAEIAKAGGCDAVEFTSNREFWEKVGPRFGYEAREVKWSKAI